MAFALPMVIPVAVRGNFSGHDFEFHLASWMEVARQWHEGVLYPRWAPGAHYGFGEPRFIFYPPISWILGATLGIFLPWAAVPGVFAWLSLTLAGISTYRLVREWLPPGAALWAAGLYVTNPYSLLVVYHRSSFAELLASALYPLALLYTLRAARPAAEGSDRDVLRLALVVAAIWLTNAPAAVITCYSVAFLLVIAALRRKSFEALWRGSIAVALGTALCGFYLLPARYEQKWVHIEDALVNGLRPEDNFPFTIWLNAKHQYFDLLLSSLAMLELLLAVFLFSAAWLALRRSSRDQAAAPGPRLNEAFFPLLCLGLVAGMLLLHPTLPLWERLPLLKFVQFPWRLLYVLNLAMALAVVTALAPRRARHSWKILVLVFWLFMNSISLYLPPWETTDIRQFAAAIDSGAGYESTEEYVPSDASFEQLEPGIPDVAPADPETPPGRIRWVVEEWRAEEKRVAVESPEPQRLALRLLSFPAWQVEVNGQRVETEPDPVTGQIVVPVPEGHSLVRVHFARTADRTAGAVISACAIAVLFVILWFQRRQGPATRL